MFARVGAASALLALASCTTTVDSVGYNGPGGVHLRRVKQPATYPNPFRDELGKSDAEIATKIAATFSQLFYGNADQMIYYQTSADQAYIQDVLHGDIRTEGIGLAMMITIELDKRLEFDRLWTYASTQMKQKKGSLRSGYFQSSCDTVTGTEPCDDPYGEAQMVTALIFAHDRWTSTSGPVDYEAGAVELLDVMRHKQDQNGGVVGGITDTFDSSTALPFSVPDVKAANTNVGRPSIVMPAYYDLWEQATDDPFWTRAAVAARAYWQRSAHGTTGLTPIRARFDGTPEVYYERFGPEAYRAQINMTLDRIWSGGNDWEVEESDKLIRFFFGQGMNYGTSYMIDGTVPMGARDPALVVVNGVTAMVATDSSRLQYMNAVWDLVLPTGMPRYYSGILDLTALLILSGQYRVW
jgi:oligosaccharide reducing-end xylanase